MKITELIDTDPEGNETRILELIKMIETEANDLETKAIQVRRILHEIQVRYFRQVAGRSQHGNKWAETAAWARIIASDAHLRREYRWGKRQYFLNQLGLSIV